IMSVNPGFGGQSFIPHSIEKVAAARELLTRARSTAVISVDGGVDGTNAAALVAAGASILVAGSAVFGAPDPGAAVQALARAAGDRAYV
ncbi:MAG TPA: ribulose-phosphate 3-epimerase, partial [Blastocatellia bacterium]|nr:ribulose-phosphate 3-epimerase [Blastocatellia bacterium]